MEILTVVGAHALKFGALVVLALVAWCLKKLARRLDLKASDDLFKAAQRVARVAVYRAEEWAANKLKLADGDPVQSDEKLAVALDLAKALVPGLAENTLVGLIEAELAAGRPSPTEAETEANLAREAVATEELARLLAQPEPG